MSAALQLPAIWAAGATQLTWQEGIGQWEDELPKAETQQNASGSPAEERPAVSLTFYRKYTENLLKRYLYASMQVGRAPSLLGAPVGRGWASSRPIRTFEDAVIFVLDVEQCLSRLNSLDRQMLCRIVLQAYTQAEAAALLGMSVRSVSARFPEALDRLTRKLLDAQLLVLPD
jgi:hypothetical protein